MKYLVVDPDTALYVKEEHDWTPNRCEAWDFKTVQAADAFREAHQLNQARILLLTEKEAGQTPAPQ